MHVWFFTETFRLLLQVLRWAGRSQYRPTFRQQYLQKGKSKHYLCLNRFHRILNQTCNGIQLIDFALVALKLLIFKVCVITGISQIGTFNFFGIERIKQNQKNIKNYSKPHKVVI